MSITVRILGDKKCVPGQQALFECFLFVLLLKYDISLQDIRRCMPCRFLKYDLEYPESLGADFSNDA